MKQLTPQEKVKLFDFFQKMKEKEFRFELSYSDRYLQKVKTFLKYLHPRRKN